MCTNIYSVCVGGEGSIAKWLGHWPGNRIVPGLIPSRTGPL